MELPQLKLTYLNFTGLAEAVRLALVVGGIPFEDERLSRDGVDAKRAAGELPYGQVPVLEIDGAIYGQSNALLRYVGGLSKLYPRDDALARLRVDGVMDAMQDVIVLLFLNATEKGRREFVEEKIPRFFTPVDRILVELGGPFLLGETLSVADMKVYSVARILSGGMEYVPEDVLERYGAVQRLVKAVGENEKVKEWNLKKHEISDS